MRGEIILWKPDNGYGFIKAEAATTVFMHVSQVLEGEPRVGAAVTFKWGDSPKDKRRMAVEIRIK